jgi:hypothetical protein
LNVVVAQTFSSGPSPNVSSTSTQSSVTVVGLPNVTFAVPLSPPIPTVVVVAEAVFTRLVPSGSDTGPYVHWSVAPAAIVSPVAWLPPVLGSQSTVPVATMSPGVITSVTATPFAARSG